MRQCEAKPRRAHIICRPVDEDMRTEFSFLSELSFLSLGTKTDFACFNNIDTREDCGELCAVTYASVNEDLV